MINLVDQTLKQYNMLQNQSIVTVALSGGADSIVLLNVMIMLSKQYGITIKAAHLNHNLRGTESDRDEQFVRSVCAKANVELKVKSVDVRKLAQQQKQSVELAARNARYAFFAECDGVVATAHTADDNIETVLLNLVRGTGVNGLCGIPPVRSGIIRPLIMCTRSQIEEFCQTNNLEFVTDSTNLTDDYTRNKLRHNVVNVLKEINPSVSTVVLRTCGILRDENAFLSSLTDVEYKRLINLDGIDVAKAKKLDKSLLLRVLRKYAEDVMGCSIDNYHTEKLFNLVYKGEGNCQLSRGFCAWVLKKNLKIIPDVQEDESFSVQTQVIDIQEYKSKLKVNNLLSKCAIDYDKIVGDTIVRCRTQGDSIKLKGKGTKTLKKLYNEIEIAHNLRRNLPVIADDCGVIWVCTAGADQRVQITRDTKKVLLISAQQDRKESVKT